MSASDEWANDKPKEKSVYTDEQRQKAMRALIEAGKELAAVIKRVAPEFREIGKKFAASLEEIAEGKK